MSLSIVEILEKKGSMTDLELQKELKSNFGEVSFRELNTGLMKLELAGVLWVSRLMRGKRQVELRQTCYRLDKCQLPQPQRLQLCPPIRNAPTVRGPAAGRRKYFRANRRVFTVLTATALERVELRTQAYLEDLPTKVGPLARIMLSLSGIYRTGQTGPS